jgi:hypothetical protein
MKTAYLTLLSTILITLWGCTQVTSLNMKKHQFGRIPTQIVWFQIAGLTEDQLALLKYSYPTADINTAFEDFLCLGKTWEFNLFKIRPQASETFLSQLTGSKNIKGECSDYLEKPFWSYYLSSEYKIGIFEKMGNKTEESLLESKKCDDDKAKNFLSNTTTWQMSNQTKNEKINYFHVNGTDNFLNNQTYYDRSFSNNECFTTLSANLASVFERYTKNYNNYFFIVRDFSYAESIGAANIKKSKEILNDLDKAIKYFQKLQQKDSSLLLLVSTAAPQGLDFPNSGKEWTEFEKSGKNILYKRRMLMNSIYAIGARAENFCGIYETSDVFTRLMTGPKQQGLELQFINPFLQ